MRPRPLARAVAARAASALARLRRPAADGDVDDGPRSASTEPATYRCGCGQPFRVSGTGRHRVYWLAGAPEDDPVLSPSCPSCDRPLPRDSEPAAGPGAAATNAA
jgi:hypothetical protein